LAAFAFASLPQVAQRAAKLLGGNIARAREFFADHPQLELAEPPGSSVVFPRLRGADDAGAFVHRLLTEQDVAVAPGHFFDAPGHFRISLAGRPDALRSGLERLAAALA
jgi:aspartate/methionine/tyrosine aminotransferase